ncbi:MAG: hypothetical protein RLZZ385_1807 [Pseudomonadota bacterium]|jgi:cytochrome c peroxidase
MKTSLSFISILALLIVAPAGADQSGYDWGLPEWAPTPLVPADNPMTSAKVELGRHLFYDNRLSADATVSCGTCHQQEKGFTDGRALPIGIQGTVGVRSAMGLANVAYLPVLTWANPLMKSLEIQALVPIFGSHPVEMGMEGREVELFARLAADPRYPDMFRAAFPERDGAIDLATITRAIAAFERSLVSFDSPYYRYKYGGQPDAITDSARRGEQLFFSEKLECYHCHGGLSFTDNVIHSRLPFGELGFHNTGLYNVDGQGGYPPGNPGVMEVTDDPADEGKFRTPGLINVAVTAPYMHDGSVATLEDALLLHYGPQGRAVTDGQPVNPNRSMFIVGFQLSDQELADVIAFLESLTDTRFLSDSRWSNPFENNH